MAALHEWAREDLTGYRETLKRGKAAFHKALKARLAATKGN